MPFNKMYKFVLTDQNNRKYKKNGKKLKIRINVSSIDFIYGKLPWKQLFVTIFCDMHKCES